MGFLYKVFVGFLPLITMNTMDFFLLVLLFGAEPKVPFPYGIGFRNQTSQIYMGLR